jgi:hypothetical protein
MQHTLWPLWVTASLYLAIIDGFRVSVKHFFWFFFDTFKED